MSTSKPIKNIPSPNGDAKASAYSRFIPGEELSSFSPWTPGTLSGTQAPGDLGVKRAEPQAEKPAAEDPAALLHAARQMGYQDGYRDGLAALDGFKQSFAAQITAQVGALTQSYGLELDALQQDMARALAVSATHLARQIVRSELVARPKLVITVAQEALDTLLLSARQITVRVHPDDHPLVAQGAAEVLSARQARLLSDASVMRGGCLVESDIGVIDATIEARWRRASASLGCEEPWTEVSGSTEGIRAGPSTELRTGSGAAQRSPDIDVRPSPEETLDRFPEGTQAAHPDEDTA